MPRQPADIAKADLFRELGYGGDHAPLDQLLAARGLSNPRKTAISISKRQLVRDLLASAFFPVCNRGDCRAAARSLAGARALADAASQAACAVCGGSVNQRAVDAMVDAARRAGVTRLCIVGGSPATREELTRAVAGRIELRCIDGTAAPSAARAADNTRWAGLVVIWGSTQLDHTVSSHYRGPKVITAPKRGIADLADCARRRLQRPPGKL